MTTLHSDLHEEEEVIATLAFGVPELPASEGMLALFADGAVQLWPSDATRAEFDAFTGGVSNQAVAWGASLLVGFAALGGLLWMKRQRGAAWGLFGLSGLSGVAGAFVRAEAERVGASLTARHWLGRTATVTQTRSGGISYAIHEPGMPPWSVTLSPDEFDREQGRTFLTAVAAAAAAAR